MNSYFQNQLVKEILNKYRVIWGLRHALSLMEWDMETYMPREGVNERGVAIAELSLLARKYLLDEKFVELVDKASQIDGLNEYEKGVIRVLKREIEWNKKIPENVIYELAKIRPASHEAWVEAKKKDNFEIFKPYLEKIVELTRKISESVGYEEHPYDPLLDHYEEGLTTRKAEALFDLLKGRLRMLIDKIANNGVYPSHHRLEDMQYDEAEARQLVTRILNLLNYPSGRGRVDIAPHPFTIELSRKDVRITVRYEGKDIKKAMYSAIHEFGHALYELQVDENLEYTPIAGGVSLGIHESQSRFWENIVGRSYGFIKLIYSDFTRIISAFKPESPMDLYLYVNTVKPNLIRVDADEVTYNAHIIVRFELEKMLVNNEIRVDDLPELWSELYEKYLGIRPSTYSEGVLQDIHWSGGMIGYFPTYSIGTLLSAQIKYAIEKELGKTIDEIALENNLGLIREWLREKIHKWGSTYPPSVLLQKAMGEELNPEYFVKYIESKYLKLPEQFL
ncbi:MAG: carboxypeptidase M32 [Fervidicoccaceae archaeon]